jgi:long-chain acyl-CoA synthetase
MDDSQLPPFEESVGRVVDRLYRQVEAAAAESGLTIPQYRLLTNLSQTGLASAILASKLDVSRPTVTSVVDGLVARGLVERLADPVDRRRLDVTLTLAGQRTLSAANTAVAERLESILSHLGPRKAGSARTAIGYWRLALDRWRESRVPATSAAL